jgi:hypothetical protein
MIHKPKNQKRITSLFKSYNFYKKNTCIFGVVIIHVHPISRPVVMYLLMLDVNYYLDLMGITRPLDTLLSYFDKSKNCDNS